MLELFTNYEMLKVTWWLLIGILFIGFAITDGYDLGSAALLGYLGKNDTERRVVVNAVAPHWDGNQVWLVTGAGAIFAAWPTVYATAFSGFYWAMLVVLFSLMLRPLAFEYRAKVEDHQKKWCDLGLMISGTIPAIIFGVAIGNLFQGFGFSMDDLARTTFHSGFFDLLNPFGLFCGVLGLTMILLQGASWLNLRTTGPVQERSEKLIRVLALAVIVLFAIGGFWISKMPGYVITSAIDTAGPASPLNKTVAFGEVGIWLHNYTLYPLMMLAPVLAFAGALGAALFSRIAPALTFVCSSLTQAGIIATSGLSLFPFILPSSSHPDVSLTVWDATSSATTLGIMTGVALVFVPLILCYTTWCFWKMWFRVDNAHIEDNKHSLY